MASLVEIREELTEKRKYLHDLWLEAGPDIDMGRVTSLNGDSDAKVAEFQRLQRELTDLGQKYDRLALVEAVAQQNETEYKRLTEPVGGPPMPGGSSNGRGSSPVPYQPKRLRQYIADHRGYKEFKAGQRTTVVLDIPEYDFKTLITLTTVNAQASRLAPVDMALEERTVSDLMGQGSTDNNTIEYYEETTFTNAAATVAEGTAKAESAIAWTLRTENVRKIAHWIPATKESLDDVSFLESTIRTRLAFGVQRTEETQLLTGDGTAPNLRGIINRSGIQTQAKAADPTPDAIYRAMQKVRGAAGSGFAEPDAVVLHPNDWTDIKLLRTTDGIYIWGNPSDEGPDRIWGKQVRQTTGMTEGTGLTGAFRAHAQVIRREGVTVTLSTEHASYFIENKVAILAESRLALAVFRPSAFATITGI
jgi:hypothetical protein